MSYRNVLPGCASVYNKATKRRIKFRVVPVFRERFGAGDVTQNGISLAGQAYAVLRYSGNLCRGELGLARNLLRRYFDRNFDGEVLAEPVMNAFFLTGVHDSLPPDIASSL